MAYFLDSLRGKIVFAYATIAILVAGLSLLIITETRLIQAQVAAGERIGQFLGTSLELRRFEKNYFLYRQRADLDEARTYLEQARRLLSEHSGDFAAFEAPAGVAALREALDTYAGLLDAISAAPTATSAEPLLEARIRDSGKLIATTAEQWSRAEHVLLQEQLARHRHLLLAAIGVVAVLVVILGQWLGSRVARPLKEIEERMAAIATGRSMSIDLRSHDREIASLTDAFNHVIHQLELRQGQLVRADKLAALGTLLSGVAHELNNPLSNISTSCEILTEELGAQPDGSPPTDAMVFQRELLEQIDTETWRARRIVRSLLDYARDRDFRREPVPLAALIDDSLRLLRPQLPPQIEIITQIPAQLSVSGDRQRLQQALFNLLGNGIDALEGAGTLRLTAAPAEGPLPGAALVFGQCPMPAIDIAVADDGHGIAPEMLPRIFDPFFTTKEVGHGLGLGLFIVFEIVEEHGGCIAVNSSPGHGTRFLIRLPAEENSP